MLGEQLVNPLQVTTGDLQRDTTQCGSHLEQLTGGEFLLEPTADAGLVELTSNDRGFRDRRVDTDGFQGLVSGRLIDAGHSSASGDSTSARASSRDSNSGQSRPIWIQPRTSRTGSLAQQKTPVPPS